MATPRGWHTATLLLNGNVLVAGGYSSGGNATASAELYDPTTGNFSLTGSMAVPRQSFTATLLLNGKVLVTGGLQNINSAELYDPATGLFSITGIMAVPRQSFTATLLPNGEVLVAGGYSEVLIPEPITASAELYNPATGNFSSTGSMTTTRENHTATLLTNGKVLIAGGDNAGSGYPIASAELFQ